MGAGSSVAGEQAKAVDGNWPPVSEYDAVYTEWGQLGLTIQTDNNVSSVTTVNEIAAAAGVAKGSELLMVNGEPIAGKSHNQVIDMISEASWPKTLRFRTTDLAHVERVKRAQKGGGVVSPEKQTHAQVSLVYGGGKDLPAAVAVPAT
jgi:hypothetical protein